MLNAFNLSDETALITGGGTGLGFGMAKCFAQAGAKVVLVGRRETELKKAAAEIGSQAFYVPADITQVDRADELVRRASEAVGGAPISMDDRKRFVMIRPG